MLVFQEKGPPGIGKIQGWKKDGLSTFFLTGSYVEFHWTPLIKLLQSHLEQDGDDTDIVNDPVARRRVGKTRVINAINAAG